MCVCVCVCVRERERCTFEMAWCSPQMRIKAQLAYMKPDNFFFTLSLFLSIINVDKIKSVDVSQISI